MNQSSPGILILGGGVAGMSAALALKDQTVPVHLVEKSEKLGGHAAAWACMATTTCQNCGACLAHEMADQVTSEPRISVHTQTRVTALSREKDGLAATLSSGKTLAVAQVIVATGFSAFDPGTLPSLHTPAFKNVITTAQLNALIQEEALGTLVGDAPRIAFLQCVGSRDRKSGRDYCSQVCCKISLRHATKLIHLLPKAKISLFYLDLQVVGKETRTLARDLEGQVELIQGVPAEILEDRQTGALTMVTEDRATLSRVARNFDLVVLSVGMTPDPDTAALAALLGISPNSWGFFNTDQAALKEDIIVAGCANGPKDILGSKQEGEIAAARAIQALGRFSPEKAGLAVLGQGTAARAAVSAAAAQGHPVFCLDPLSPLPQGAQDLSGATLICLDGTLGSFNLFIEHQGKKKTIRCGAIILAPEPESLESQIPGALSLGDFSTLAEDAWPDRLVFLLDHAGPEFKAAARDALDSALRAKKAQKTVSVLMNKMLVHGPEGQRLYDEARQAGVRFLRYDSPKETKITARDGKVEICLKEATLAGQEVLVEADLLVVPSTIRPAQGFAPLARLFKLDLDQEGFLQGANVRHRLVQSPRRGIFFAGPCHDDTDAQDLSEEVLAILGNLALKALAQPGTAPQAVTIHEKKCAKCLTCYRVCPHGAIILNEKRRPMIVPDACFSCQACLANCPAYAIEAQGLDNDSLGSRAAQGKTLVLACERSGALAAQNLPDTVELQAVPCACRVSADLLLKALVNGAARVIVSSCHSGNCRSKGGTAEARAQVERVRALPGVTKDRVVFQTAAANESAAFARMIKALSERG